MAVIQVDIEVKGEHWQAGALFYELDLEALSKRIATLMSHMAYDVKEGKGVPPPNVFNVASRRYR
jgi:hypothetical protein